MSSDKKIEKNQLSRPHPPVMPMGFRAGISNEVMVIDFIDTPNNNEAVIFSSIVLTKETAKNLLESLASFVEKK